MATRSHIYVQAGKGQKNEFKKVYAHYDGYPSHHLPLLVEYYNKREYAHALVKGDISVVDKYCTLPADGAQHDFDHRAEGYTLYYGRDRGEADTSATFTNHLTIDEEYAYVYLIRPVASHPGFVGKGWYVVAGNITYTNHEGEEVTYGSNIGGDARVIPASEFYSELTSEWYDQPVIKAIAA